MIDSSRPSAPVGDSSHPTVEEVFGPQGVELLKEHASALRCWDQFCKLPWNKSAATKSWNATFEGCEGRWEIEISSRGRVFIGRVDKDLEKAHRTYQHLEQAALFLVSDLPQTRAQFSVEQLAVMEPEEAGQTPSYKNATLTALTIPEVNRSVAEIIVGLESGALAHKPKQREIFSFEIPLVEILHHGTPQRLSVSASYQYVANLKTPEMPDYREMKADIELFLREYPNQMDFWEELNRNLVSAFLKKYSMLESAAVTLTVLRREDPELPEFDRGLRRSSTVAMKRQEAVVEVESKGDVVVVAKGIEAFSGL